MQNFKFLNHKKVLQSLVLFLFFILPFVSQSQTKIFDSKKKIIIITHDSVNPSSAFRSRISRFLKQLGLDTNLIKVIESSSRMSGVEVSPNGNPEFKVKAGSGQTDWLSNVTNTILGAKAQAGCTDCQVIFIAYASPYSFIANKTDTAAINRSVREWKFMCDKVKDAGASLVFPSTIHYNFSHRRLAENEPLMVQEFNKRNYGFSGIDMVTPTMIDYPLPSLGDKRHNTNYGLEIYGHQWFKALIENDGLQMPSWSDSMVQAAKQEAISWHSSITLISPKNGKFKVGDQITLKWESNCTSYYTNLSLQMHFRRMDNKWDGGVPFIVKYLIPSGQGPGGSFQNQGGTVACAAKQYTFTLTQSMVDFMGTTNQAFPVYFQISSPDDHPKCCYTHFDESTLDYANPENMVLIYPGNQINTSIPIYPGSQTSSANIQRAIIKQSDDYRILNTHNIKGLFVQNISKRSNLSLYDIKGKLYKEIKSNETVHINKSGLFILSTNDGNKTNNTILSIQ